MFVVPGWTGVLLLVINMKYINLNYKKKIFADWFILFYKALHVY